MSSQAPIRVMIVDDSAFARQLFKSILEADDRFEVVALAKDGQEALARLEQADPTVLALDLDMPGIDGFSFLRILMRRRPKPVVVVSSYAGRSDVLRALDLGAIDFVAKPTKTASTRLADISDELKDKLVEAASARIDLYVQQAVQDVTGLHSLPALKAPIEPLQPTGKVRTLAQPKGLVVLGASTGGPRALRRMLRNCDLGQWAMAIAQHMPAMFTSEFAARLARKTGRIVEEGRQGQRLAAGHVTVAPGGFHMELFTKGGWPLVRLIPPETDPRYVPSVDRLFESAARAVGSRLVAVVLTGMGRDGLRGAKAVKEAGGLVIAEHASTAVVYGMPRQIVEAGLADEVLPLEEIPAAIERFTGGQGQS